MQATHRSRVPGIVARLAATGAILSGTAWPAAAEPPPLPTDLPPSLEGPAVERSAPETAPAGPPAEAGPAGESSPVTPGEMQPETRGTVPEEERSRALGSPPGRLGGLGLLDLLPPSGAGTPVGSGIFITPSLLLQGLVSDNVNGQSGKNRHAGFIGTATPDLFARADTTWLRGNLRYAPSFQYHTEGPDHTRILHFFNGQALAMLVPETLFLDLRGSASVSPTFGTSNTSQAAVANPQNTIQYTSLQASPYLFHRFGSLATVRVGYLFQYGDQSGNSAFIPNTAQPFFTSQHFIGNGGYLVARTGEDFGRLALQTQLEGTSYSGTGVLDGAHRASGVLQARYAIQRGIAVFVEGGYENQHYVGLPPINITGPVWSVGVRLTPTPDSIIIAKYGRRNGFESPYLNASTRLTARTRLSAIYFETLSTGALAPVDLLSSTSLDELGNPVDVNSGAPVYTPFGVGLLAAQTSLQRFRSGVATLSHEWVRDTVSLSVSYQETKPISLVPGTTAFSQRGISGSLAWAHEFSPEMIGIGFLQYGHTQTGNTVSINRAGNPVVINSPGFGSGDFVTVGGTLNYQFTPTLIGYMQYMFTYRDIGGAGAINTTQNVLIAGIRQTF